MKTFIDVGCNRGSYAFGWLSNPEIRVFAFEPNPVLYAELKAKETDRFKIFDNAVGITEGVQKFNIGQNDATSSLKNFAEECTAFKYSHAIDVNVVRLDKFCEAHNIDVVDHIKIDAQGSDLEVLKSFGEHIRKVKEIMVEAFINNDSFIYEDEVKESQVAEYLTAFGFKLINRAVDGNYADLTYVNELL